jgi:hypothetical protein
MQRSANDKVMRPFTISWSEGMDCFGSTPIRKPPWQTRFPFYFDRSERRWSAICTATGFSLD